MTSEWLRRIEEYLWPNGFRRDAWMIVDAARDQRIFGMLLDCFYSGHTCLFSGAIAPELKIAAPYLVQLEYDDEKTKRFISQAWGNSWGVFLRCSSRPETLRRHLRGFLVVRDPSGRKMLFRYYDPRVLRVYLPTCTAEELRTVFGPIECFRMEDENAGTMLEFGFDREELVTNRISEG
jgi:hypothetical protein